MLPFTNPPDTQFPFIFTWANSLNQDNMNTKRYFLPVLTVFAMAILAGCAKDTEQETEDTVPQPLCPATITDIDGNVYPVIQIGNQCWTLENLRTTRYNDGTSIATGLSASEWETTTTGAYAIYEDSIPLEATYGKLYNGHAAATGMLCPEGWRIPTDEDFNALETFLGMPAAELYNTGERGSAEGIGLKLKSTSIWDPSSFEGTNSSGFTALPAGTRNSVGDYITLKQYAIFWTSTPYVSDSNYLWNHHVYYNGPGVSRIFETKNRGYSCRCIKE
jgi:uncharacterized protein (TIGR02145 family)